MRAARVVGNGIVDPSSETRPNGPNGPDAGGFAKFHPVYVASGTATSGSLMPPRSLPSSSTAGTRSGSGAPAPAPPSRNVLAMRVPPDRVRGEETFGIAGHARA